MMKRILSLVVLFVLVAMVAPAAAEPVGTDASSVAVSLSEQSDSVDALAATLPDVRTSTVTSITPSSATIWGWIANDGGSSIAERRFDWGQSTPLTQVIWSDSITVSGNYFSGTISGLSPNTGYYYRAWAKNSAGWSYGDILSFTTEPATDTLSFTDLTPSTITTSQSTYDATLLASGSNFNNVNQVTFSWSGSDSGSQTWNKGDTSWNTKVTVNSDTSMTLHSRVLSNAGGAQTQQWTWTVTLRDTSGATKSRTFFVTLTPEPIVSPSVSTSSAANVGSNQATLNGQLTSMGGAPSCTVYFEYGPTSSLGSTTSSQSMSSTGLFSWTITDGTPGTKYFYRAVASNSAGTIKGDIQEWTYQQQIIFPSITGVDPSQPEVNPNRQWLSILGSGFVSQSQVTLRIDGNKYPISSDRTDFVSANNINVLVGLTAPGKWKVLVSNPDGQQSNEYEFDVKSPTQPGGRYRINWENTAVNGWFNPLGENNQLWTHPNYDYDSQVYLANNNMRHAGLDIVSEYGQEVTGQEMYAIADGQVTQVSGKGGRDECIIIQHYSQDGPFFAIYGHIDTSSKGFEKGSPVYRKQKIGIIRDTTYNPDHLHFGINTKEKIDNFQKDGNGWGRTKPDTDPRYMGWQDPIPFLESKKSVKPIKTFKSDHKTYDFGEPVEISYSVSTEKGIEEIEILRSDDDSKDLDEWDTVWGICLREDLKSYSGSIRDMPLYCDKYCYMIRVKDKEGHSFTAYEAISIEVKNLPENGKWLRILNEDRGWVNSISINDNYCGYTNLININEYTQNLALSNDQINTLSENTDPALVNKYYGSSLEAQENLYAVSTSYTVKAKKNGYLEDVQSISADFSGVKDITVSLLEDPNHEDSIDIVAERIYIKGNSASPGDRINIEADIINDGELASRNFIVRGAILGGSEFSSIQINNLNPGERYTIDEWSTVWPTDQDELLIWIWVDSSKTVSESDELNNLLIVMFKPTREIPVSPTPEPTINPQPSPSIPKPDEPDCWVYITTDPIGSSVYLDGNYVDQSPVSLHATAGTHQLRIEKSGYETYSETLEFVEDEYPTKNIQLTPIQDIDTIIVDGSGEGDYVTIQGAVDAATPYDDIIIRYNNGIPYNVFSIDKEGVTIRAESDEFKPVIKTPNGEITIDASGITLKGLEIKDSAGITAAGSKLSIISCNIINNSKYNGGGLWLWKDGNDALIEGTRFENNTAEFSGGGLLIYHADNIVIHNSEFINNTAKGGIAAARIDGSSRIERTIFLNNHVPDKIILSSFDLILHNCLFENNNAETIVYSSPEISSEIKNSKFISNDGCGVYLRLDSNAIGTVKNSEFKGNRGPYGGLTIEGLDTNSHAEICHNTFIGNSENSESVGIYLYNQYLNPSKIFIYDNYFNNTINIKQYRSASDSAVLVLNRTVVQKTNIIGGTNQGGNYWASPDRNGWSQKQIDTSGDGFTKAYYYEGVYDYHPLTSSIEIPSKPQANFTGTPLQGKNTLIVEFTELSDGNIVSYYWDFGDNYYSSERHPKHTYLNPGSYDVKLTVTDNDGDKSTLAKSDYVVVETTGMRPVAEWGDYGSGEGQLYNPRAIDVDSQGNVYVADSANNRIQKYNPDGTHISTWGSPSSGTGDLQFNHPLGIAAGKDDTVYIADTFNRRIQVISSTGTYIRQWGSYGTSDGQFGCPQGIAQNSSGFIYVTENYADRNCQIFDSMGNFIKSFTFEGKKCTFDVDFDSKDNIYIVDWDDRLVKLDKNNNIIWEFTGDEISEPESFQPVSIALDSNDNIYVASSGDDRVWKISNDGEFLIRFGIDGSPDSKFDSPQGIAIDNTGLVYVLELGSSKMINKFEPRFLDLIPDFLVSSVEGEAPMTVIFSDSSTGEPSSWSWDFGDGNKGSGSIVTHTYENPGEYSVSMTVDNGIVKRTKSCSNLITVSNPRPIAEYSANVTDGQVPLSVQFNDDSIGEPASWLWDFGDGNTSSEQNPKHTYCNAGVYDVTLIVSNEHGSDSRVKSDYINVTTPSVQNTLSFDPPSSGIRIAETTKYNVVLDTVPAGLSGFNISVALTDPSVGEIVGVSCPSWALLPKNSSLPADSVFVQAVDLDQLVGVGATNVTLCTLTIRGDATGTTNLTITPIKVDDDIGGRYTPGTTEGMLVVESSQTPVVANFTANVTAGTIPFTVQFTDTSTGDPTAWNWSFGDGNTSTEQHPTHTYTTPGTYTVNLTVSTGSDSDRFSRSDYITVTRVKGDFNGDGIVNIGDVAKVAYMVVGKTDADPDADFNENGAVDIGDAAKIAYYFVGKIGEL